MLRRAPVSRILLVTIMWTHKPQECEGDYYFSGRAFQTSGVAESLPPEEIGQVVSMLKSFVDEHEGADYLKVFEHSEGRTVWCICQLSKAMIASGEYSAEDDYWTMLLPEEY